MRSLATSFLLAITLAVLLVAVGCGSGDAGDPAPPGAGQGDDGTSQGDVGDDTPGTDSGDHGLVGGDDSQTAPPATPITTTTAVATADVNLRSGPATTYAILAVIPKGASVTLLSATPTNAFYNAKYNGVAGWAHSSYLQASTAQPPPTTTGDLEGVASPANALARGAKSTGFSYWWGGGAWLADGPTASTKGSCSGNCPSCTHSGTYGADCSGMVAKAWQYGTKALEVNSHPYSTSSFVNDVAGKWSTVSRGAMKPADALVYNVNGAGHIVLWEKGDGWGASTVYECKGCSYGCVHDTRTFTSAYHAIRRAGF